ncbi:MAG: DUF1273 family protein [Oscillospiraceae bacterium]|nr:DUF1273 family protein [Oscillospiraceae bacterium]
MMPFFPPEPYERPVHTVCFSGHRPAKLPQGKLLQMIQSLLFEEIRQAVQQGATVFYTGLAQGIDLWAADYVLRLRKDHPQIRLIGVKPFAGCGDPLRGDDRYHFACVVHAADAIIALQPAFTRDCYRKRNQYMVDHSDTIIAVVDSMRSGTGQAIRMAQSADLQTRIISVTEIRDRLQNSYD